VFRFLKGEKNGVDWTIIYKSMCIKKMRERKRVYWWKKNHKMLYTIIYRKVIDITPLILFSKVCKVSLINFCKVWAHCADTYWNCRYHFTLWSKKQMKKKMHVKTWNFGKWCVTIMIRKARYPWTENKSHFIRSSCSKCTASHAIKLTSHLRTNKCQLMWLWT